MLTKLEPLGMIRLKADYEGWQMKDLVVIDRKHFGTIPLGLEQA
jgi:hypothetical protein